MGMAFLAMRLGMSLMRFGVLGAASLGKGGQRQNEDSDC
jgi:hypothetical protein